MTMKVTWDKLGHIEQLRLKGSLVQQNAKKIKNMLTLEEKLPCIDHIKKAVNHNECLNYF